MPLCSWTLKGHKVEQDWSRPETELGPCLPVPTPQQNVEHLRPGLQCARLLFISGEGMKWQLQPKWSVIDLHGALKSPDLSQRQHRKGGLDS